MPRQSSQFSSASYPDPTSARRAWALDELEPRGNFSFPSEMDEHSSEVVRVLLHPVIQRLDLFLIEEPQHPLLQLTASLAWDDLDQRRLLLHCLVDDGSEGPVDIFTSVVDVVEVQLQFHPTRSTRPRAYRGSPATPPAVDLECGRVVVLCHG